MSTPERSPDALIPVSVPDDRFADLGIPAGALVWVDPRVTPRPGDVVRLGRDEPIVLRRYDPRDADQVTGAVRLVEWRPR